MIRKTQTQMLKQINNHPSTHKHNIIDICYIALHMHVTIERVETKVGKSVIVEMQLVFCSYVRTCCDIPSLGFFSL